MSQEIQHIQPHFEKILQDNSRTAITAGTTLLLMGVFSVSAPLVVGLSLTVLIGIILAASGVGQLTFALNGKHVLSIISGLFMLAIGGYIALNPDTVMEMLIVFVALYLIVTGFFEVFMAYQIKPAKNWKWCLFGGISSVLLGFILWILFPLLGAWIIGFLLGIKLIFSGVILILFGLSARSSKTEISTSI